MIKQNHENESSQKISARKNSNRISQITSHIETKCKTRYQHTFAANRLINIHRNNEHFSEKLTKSCVQKEKDCCERENL
jgi:thymidylate kinase